MKTKTAKVIFSITGIIIIAVLLALRFDVFKKLQQKLQQKTQQTEQPQPQPAPAAPPAPKSTPAVRKTAVPASTFSKEEHIKILREEMALGDPFSYTTGRDGEYTPLTNSKQVGLISVKGIIEVEGKKPIAILHLKDTERNYYVSKGDVIRITTKASNSDAPVEVYIVIKNIGNEEVELVQQERPDKVIIIR